MPANAGVIRAAVALRSAEPELWAGFVSAVRAYADEALSDMLRCQPEMLQRGQGMIIMANEIATLLADAPVLVEKLRKT